MSAINLIKYPTDVTGIHPDNLVQAEVHEVRPNHRIITPREGYFYAKGLEVRIPDRILTLGLDYTLTDLNDQATKLAGQSVFTSIHILDTSGVQGDVTIRYQCYGSGDQFSREVLKNLVDSANTERVTSWYNVVNRPFDYPPSPHRHKLSEVYGWLSSNQLLSYIVQILSHMKVNKDRRIYSEFLKLQQLVNNQLGNFSSTINEAREQVGSINQLQERFDAIINQVKKEVEALSSLGNLRTLLAEVKEEVITTEDAKIELAKTNLNVAITELENRLSASIGSINTKLGSIADDQTLTEKLNAKLDVSVFNSQLERLASKDDVTRATQSLSGYVTTSTFNEAISNLGTRTISYSQLTDIPTFMKVIAEQNTAYTDTLTETAVYIKNRVADSQHRYDGKTPSESLYGTMTNETLVNFTSVTAGNQTHQLLFEPTHGLSFRTKFGNQTDSKWKPVLSYNHDGRIDDTSIGIGYLKNGTSSTGTNVKTSYINLGNGHTIFANRNGIYLRDSTNSANVSFSQFPTKTQLDAAIETVNNNKLDASVFETKINEVKQEINTSLANNKQFIPVTKLSGSIERTTSVPQNTGQIPVYKSLSLDNQYSNRNTRGFTGLNLETHAMRFVATPLTPESIISNGIDVMVDDAGYLNVNGKIKAVNLNLTSDKNLKHDIKRIENATDKLKEIGGYLFKMNEGGSQSGGVIAQEVKEVLPEAVDGVDGNMSVNYQAIIGLLIESLNDANKRIELLEKRLAQAIY